MKKLLLSIGLVMVSGTLVYGAKANPQGELTATFAENFNTLTNGSESTPAEDEISASGKIDASLMNGAQWRGRGLHEAGGSLAVMHFEQSDWFGTESVQGYIQTPYIDVRMDDGNFTLRFRARTLTEASGSLKIELYDAYTTNSIEAADVDINSEWATYEVELSHPGYGNHLAYMQMASTEEDWLIDDLEIVQDYYALSAPIVHYARNVSYEQFTGRWNAVPLAESYLVSVYSLDKSDNRVYLVKDAKTNECTMTVEGTEKGTDYYYYVRSTNAKYTSDESDVRKVHVALNELETPVTLAAEKVSTDGFTARWEPTFRAMGYIIGLKKQYVATEDMLVTVVSEGFEKITDGDIDWPYSFYGDLDEYTTIPGWGYNFYTTRTAASMMVIDNSWKKYGEECYLSTPALDLSGDGGRFVVSLNVYGDKDNVVSVTCGEKTLTHTLDVQGTQEFSLEFDNGTASSVIRIEFDGEAAGYYSYLFIDDVNIQQYAHTGDPITENIGSYKTETTDTSYDFTGLNAKKGDTFVYTVKAWSYSLDEDGVWGPDVFSEESKPQSVLIDDTTGLENVTADAKTIVSAMNGELIIIADEATTAEIYSVNGRLIVRYDVAAGNNTFTPEYNGVTIVKVGNEVFRVILR